MRLVFSILTQEERILFAKCSKDAKERGKVKAQFLVVASVVDAIRAIGARKDVVNKTCKPTYFAIGTAIAKPEFKAELARLGAELAAMSPPKTLRQFASEWEKNSHTKSKRGRSR